MAVPEFPFADGAREYQIDALNTWKEHGCQGFFAMATGTGKTVTALNCLLDSYMEKGRYRCLILVPTISLVDQWQKECRRFNFNNIVRISSKERHWKDDITRITASALFDQSSSYVIIVTYASLVKKEVVAWIDELPNDTLVIADEAHNIGTENLITSINSLSFKKRIGLSATPHRQFDRKGNEAIKRYFNIKDGYTYEYSMGEAIQNGVLCHYEYFPHVVHLNEEEMVEYYALSKKIAKFYDPYTDTFKDSPALTALLIKRKRIIHKAYGKINEFTRIVNDMFEEKGSLKYTMVYSPEGVCPDEVLYTTELEDRDTLDDEELPMIDIYTKIVSEVEPHVTVEQFTSKEGNRGEILENFTNGSTHVLVAMKCLDEGVDVPRAENAIFCASTGNPRQFIQRRGRILRMHPEKRRAYIHDLVVAPYVDTEFETYRMERSLIKNELRRVRDFALLADNPEYAENTLQEILEYYDLNFKDDEQD